MRPTKSRFAIHNHFVGRQLLAFTRLKWSLMIRGHSLILSGRSASPLNSTVWPERGRPRSLLVEVIWIILRKAPTIACVVTLNSSVLMLSTTRTVVGRPSPRLTEPKTKMNQRPISYVDQTTALEWFAQKLFVKTVMPILVMCLMTALSPQDRGFVSIVFLLSSSLTDHRLKYHCVPNPGDSVCIQRCPKDEIPTLLTIRVLFLGQNLLRHRNYLKSLFLFILQKICYSNNLH